MSKWLARLKHIPQEATPDQVPEVRLTVVTCRHCGARYWHHLGHLATGGKIAGGPCCFGHEVLTVSEYPTEEAAKVAWSKLQGARPLPYTQKTVTGEMVKAI